MSAPESGQDKVFEAYMRQYFPRVAAGGAPAPSPGVPASMTWSGEQGQPTEEEQYEAYFRQHFPTGGGASSPRAG